MKYTFETDRPMPNPIYKENVLTFYFTEDLYNDLEYTENSQKTKELKKACQKVIDNYLPQLKHDNGVYVDNGSICFNIDNIPAPSIDDTSRLFFIKHFLADLAGYTTEKALNIELDRKKRRWFKKSGAPRPCVDASKADERIQEKMMHDCWGCFGFNTTLSPKYTRDNTSCPL